MSDRTIRCRRKLTLPASSICAAVCIIALGACSQTEPAATRISTPQPTVSASPSQSPAPSPSASPSPTPVPTPSPSPARPSPLASPAPVEPRFAGSMSEVSRERLPHSWREGCPVGIGDLRLLTLTHWGFDGRVHNGELVVHRDQASKMLRAMERIFDARFPIEKMELVDRYGADDDRSMDANNTSAFNCREVEGRPGVWSQHAYGRAIDINPVQNPYVSGSGEVSPPAGAAYANRSKRSPGMIRGGDAVVKAFASIGWEWGGYWTSSKDYQHFSSNGR